VETLRSLNQIKEILREHNKIRRLSPSPAF
jgi:hypothetical protein